MLNLRTNDNIKPTLNALLSDFEKVDCVINFSYKIKLNPRTESTKIIFLFPFNVQSFLSIFGFSLNGTSSIKSTCSSTLEPSKSAFKLFIFIQPIIADGRRKTYYFHQQNVEVRFMISFVLRIFLCTIVENTCRSGRH